MRSLLLALVLLALAAGTGWATTVQFPDKPGHAEKRITVRARGDGEWAVCRVSVKGGYGAFAKLVGRKETSESYRCTDGQTRDVRVGDYRFMAGGTVVGTGRIRATLSCR